MNYRAPRSRGSRQGETNGRPCIRGRKSLVIEGGSVEFGRQRHRCRRCNWLMDDNKTIILVVTDVGIGEGVSVNQVNTVI